MKNQSTLLALSLSGIVGVANAAPTSKPNVIIIFTDDQGFGDLGCYGSPDIKTPSIDKMAAEGLRLTSFYVSTSVSSASRAALLTGRLNSRNGVPGVFFPNAEGLSQSEITLAEALKDQGYTTACFGKWHLGDLGGHLPTDQGFDEYFGIPYSNDMYIGTYHKFADDVNFREGYTMELAKEHQKIAKVKQNARKQILSIVPLFEDDKIVEYPCDQATTTRRYFDRAIEFIDECKVADKPFFTYITPAMPHWPLAASEEFLGRSERGLYGDAVEEIDYNVGRLLDYLDENRLSKNTIVIFASDNGPATYLDEADHGSAGVLRGGKFSIYEGGVRVPFIVRWCGKIPSGKSSDAIAASIDLFPTILHYAGCKEITHHVDGINVSKFWEKPKRELRDEYIYVRNNTGKIEGIRKGEWLYCCKSFGNANKNNKPELFNIKDDISQKKNLYDEIPEKATEMQRLLDECIERDSQLK
ncbi:MAG: sulfatase [Rikenellaceae bacterium]